MKLRKALGYAYGIQAIFVTTFHGENIDSTTKVFDQPKEAKQYIKQQPSCTVEVLWYDESTGKAGFDWCDYENGKAITVSPIGLWVGGVTKEELEAATLDWRKVKTDGSA